MGAGLAKNDRSFYFRSVRKGERTRGAILDGALKLASELGLEGLTLGRLADELELSKSGLFAHFGSKEDLQVRTLDRAAERFAEVVVRPALEAPAGEKRLRVLFDRWLEWPRRVRQPGGCIFIAATAELDDRPGAARDRLVELQREWRATLARIVRRAQEVGDFRRDLDPDQLAFEIQGIGLAAHETTRLLRDARAVERARAAFERLVADARARS
jgi:AcrR family transcriptional regulator